MLTWISVIFVIFGMSLMLAGIFKKSIPGDNPDHTVGRNAMRGTAITIGVVFAILGAFFLYFKSLWDF